MKQHRRDRRSEKVAPLWADAICINQKNKTELNSLLLLVGQIYTKAATVYVSLGDVGLYWHSALSLLHRLCLVREMEEKAGQHQQQRRTPGEVHEFYGFPSMDHAAWNNFWYTFTAPWFTRTWIVQEIALANKAEVRFGPFSFRWISFLEAYVLASEIDRTVGGFKIRQGMLNVDKLLRILRFRKSDVRLTLLLHILIFTRDFQVSDPRDKIIAVLGLADPKPAKYQTVTFEPNYAISVETLYHRFAIYQVDTFCVTSILSLAGLQRRSSALGEMPSWVPDWTAQDPQIASMDLSRIRPVGYEATGDSVSWNLLCRPHPEADPDVLVMEGDCIDTIVALTPALGIDRNGCRPQYRSEVDGVKRFLRWHCAAEVLMNQSNLKTLLSITYDDPEEAFARTLLVDDTYTGGNALDTSRPIADPKLSHQIAMICLLAVEHGIGLIEKHTPTAQATFHMQVLTACEGHRFAITKRGYIALVPHCAQVGDRIALFLGTSVPFVLRESNRCSLTHGKVFFRLVGDAYVHGIMDGEAMEFENFAPQEIWLC